MTTLTGYVASPALYREVGIEAQPGDQVEIYLDQVKVPGFPEFIVGTIQNPVTVVCGGTSYPIEYDEADLAGSGVEFIEGDDILSIVVVSEARVLFDLSVHTIPQSLSSGEKLQARSNIGIAEPLYGPFLIDGLTLYNYPQDEFYVSFSITGLSGGANGVYTLASGTYYGYDLYVQTGATVAISDNTTLTGDGRIMFRSGTDGNWYLAMITAGVISDLLYTERPEAVTMDDDLTTNPYHISTWYDYSTSDALAVTVSNLVTSAGTAGVPGQLAFGDTGGLRAVWMCSQVAPYRWSKLN